MDNSNFTMPKISAGSFKFEKSVLTIATILLIVLLLQRVKELKLCTCGLFPKQCLH